MHGAHQPSASNQHRRGRQTATARRGVVVLALTLALWPSGGMLGQSAPPGDDRVARRIAALEREAAQLATQSRTLVGDVRRLEIERDLRTERAVQALAAADQARRELEAVSSRLAALRSRRVDHLPELQAQFVDLYKRGRRGTWAQIFSGAGLRDLGRARRASEALAYRRQRTVEDHQRTLADLLHEEALLRQHTQTLREQEAQAAASQQAAERAIAERAVLLDDIDGKRDLAAQYLGELQLARDRIMAELSARPGARPSEPTAIPLGPFQGALQWPASGRVVARFGQPGVLADTQHNGVEVAAAIGTPVRVVHDGVVDYAEGYTGLGTLVVVNHGANSFSLYGYLSETSVSKGDRVRAGAEVGRVGPAPVNGEPRLYFELRIDGRLVDPLQWLQSR